MILSSRVIRFITCVATFALTRSFNLGVMMIRRLVIHKG